MILGFSLSPGGLLLPYHLGVLAALDHHGFISDQTPLAGSSAGAIAVASHASGVPSHRALEASIAVSSQCYNPFFVPSGKLMGALRHEMDNILPNDAHERINHRKGITGLAHRELFPENQPVVATHFATRECLMDAVCDSSMFPFFTANKVARVVKRRNEKNHRVVVDGIFATPLERVGCPDFEHVVKQRRLLDQLEPKTKPDRTVMVTCFPSELLAFAIKNGQDAIGPSAIFENPLNPVGTTAHLAKMACMASSRKELVALYERGWEGAEAWIVRERKH